MDRGAFLSLAWGAVTTLWLSSLGIALGVPLGLAIALVRVRRVPILSQGMAGLVSVTRSTPLVTTALLIFFGLPALGITLDAKVAALCAILVNTAPFQSEVWRASLLALPKDQIDAAKAAGMRGGMRFRRIIFPQVWRISLPGMINEMTYLIKGSPAVAVVGVVDLTRAAVRVTSYTYDPITPMLSAAVIYVAAVAILVRAQRILEKRTLARFSAE